MRRLSGLKAGRVLRECIGGRTRRIQRGRVLISERQHRRDVGGPAGILRSAMKEMRSPSDPRVVFMGTPDFAVPTLLRLLDETAVVGVFTRPDRPSGRGRALRSSPVADVARAAGVPLFQPRGLRRSADAAQALDTLSELAPDVVVVAAYGLILPEAALSAGHRGALNVHASILPRWRGAAPIQHAILAGDETTGITIMLMDEGLDTGPIVATEATHIGERETAGELTERLATLGADLLARTIGPWIAGGIEPPEQDHAAATLAPSLAKSDGQLVWTESAAVLARRIRGLSPWPGAFTFLPDGTRLKVHAARAEASPAEEMPGVVLEHGGAPAVGTMDGVLVLERVQASGGRAMDAADFVRGRPEIVGWRLGLTLEEGANGVGSSDRTTLGERSEESVSADETDNP